MPFSSSPELFYSKWTIICHPLPTSQTFCPLHTLGNMLFRTYIFSLIDNCATVIQLAFDAVGAICVQIKTLSNNYNDNTGSFF